MLDLGDQDRATFAWAREYLPIAEENSQQLDLYDYIQKRAKRAAAGDLADARSKLEILWTKARFFRDPAGIAPTLGLKAPITYEQDKEQRQVEDAKAKQEADAAAQRDAVIADARLKASQASMHENTRWESESEHYARYGQFTVLIVAFFAIPIGIGIALSNPNLAPIIAIAVLLFLPVVIWVRVAKEAPELIAQLITLGGAGHARRLSGIESEEQHLMSEAQAQYQRRMDEIAVEHARTMAEIEARYAGE